MATVSADHEQPHHTSQLGHGCGGTDSAARPVRERRTVDGRHQPAAEADEADNGGDAAELYLRSARAAGKRGALHAIAGHLAGSGAVVRAWEAGVNVKEQPHDEGHDCTRHTWLRKRENVWPAAASADKTALADASVVVVGSWSGKEAMSAPTAWHTKRNLALRRLRSPRRMAGLPSPTRELSSPVAEQCTMSTSSATRTVAPR